jgi:UDP-2,3-diacylglucosamine pyrophosphatase LpxH
LKNQYVSKKNPRSEEHVVLHLSDGHHDQIVTPEECGGLERYDFPISCARGEKLVETTIDWTQNYLDKFNFPVLWVLAYGDHTSGEIHGHVNRSYFRNQFKNCFAIGQLHAMMYRELAAYFSKVCVVYVPGNHGRRSIKKDHHGAHDNWDYLIGEIAKLHSSDLENVEFIIPNSFSCNLDINGVGFNVFHGDDVRGALGIPYYGLQRRQRNMLALSHAQQGPRIRYFCCGHFHKPGSLGDMDGEMIVNGPWVATDAYAYNSFAGYTEPSQWLHGVKPSQGITWRLDVKMRRENETPKRFLIPNASEVAV